MLRLEGKQEQRGVRAEFVARALVLPAGRLPPAVWSTPGSGIRVAARPL